MLDLLSPAWFSGAAVDLLRDCCLASSHVQPDICLGLHFICLQARVIGTVALHLMLENNKSVRTRNDVTAAVASSCSICDLSPWIFTEMRRRWKCGSSKVSPDVFTKKFLRFSLYAVLICKARRPADFDDRPFVSQNSHMCNAFPSVFFML